MRSLGRSTARLRPAVTSLVAALRTCRLSCSTTTPLADWCCGGCGFRNCDFRADCFQCHQPNPRPETSQLIEDDAAASGQEIMVAAARRQKEQPGPMLAEGEVWQQAPAASLSRSVTPLSSSPFPSAPEFVAPGNARSTMPTPFKTGDWMCVCGQHNFARRVECMNCGRARRSLLPGAASVTAWTCLACYSTNPGDNRLCAICGAARSETTGTANVPGDGMQSEHATRPADWVCAECRFVNFASRGRCKRCGTSRVTSSGAGSSTLATSPNVNNNNNNGAGLQKSAEGMWRCECGYENYRTRQFCRKCGHRHRSGGAVRRQV